MKKTTKIITAVLAIALAALCVVVGISTVTRVEETTTEVTTTQKQAVTTTNATTTKKTETLAEKLIGKWTDSAAMSGFEFFADGKVSFTFANLSSLGINFDGTVDNGTYTLEGNRLTVAYSIYTATIDKVYEISIENDVLEMYDLEELKTSTFVKTDKFSEDMTSDHETTEPMISIPDEIIGSWVSDNTGKEYHFVSDGSVTVTIDGDDFIGAYVTEGNKVTVQYSHFTGKITEKYTFAVTTNVLTLTDDGSNTFTYSRKGTQSSQSTSGDALLGSWMDSANMSGYEFKEGGVVSVTYVNIQLPFLDVPVNGTYTGGYEIENDKITITCYIYGNAISNTYTYEIKGNSLKLTNVDGGNVSTYIKQ